MAKPSPRLKHLYDAALRLCCGWIGGVRSNFFPPKCNSEAHQIPLYWTGQLLQLLFIRLRTFCEQVKDGVSNQISVSVQVLREDAAIVSLYGLKPALQTLRSKTITLYGLTSGAGRYWSLYCIQKCKATGGTLSSALETMAGILDEDASVIFEYGLRPLLLDANVFGKKVYSQVSSAINFVIATSRHLILLGAENVYSTYRSLSWTVSRTLIAFYEGALIAIGLGPRCRLQILSRHAATTSSWATNSRSWTAFLLVVSIVTMTHQGTGSRHPILKASERPSGAFASLQAVEVIETVLPVAEPAELVFAKTRDQEIRPEKLVSPKVSALLQGAGFLRETNNITTGIVARETNTSLQHDAGSFANPTAAHEYTAPSRSALHEQVIREIEHRMVAAENHTERVLLSELAGHYRAIDARLHWVDASGLTAAGKALHRELETADDYGLDPGLFSLASLQTMEADWRPAAVEADLSYSAIIYARHARGWRIDPSQLSRWLDQRPAPFHVSEIFWAIEAHGGPVHGLRRFHPRHVQFERLRQAYLAEKQDIETDRSTPNGNVQRPSRQRAAHAAAKMARLEKLRLNMERWRWMPEELGYFHIWNNLPEFETRVVKNDQIIHQERVIIGREDTQTPVFSDEMSYIEFNPEWGVPESIKIRQLLPRLRGGDAGVLARRNMRIKFGDEIKKASDIQWSKIDIRSIAIVQGPGPGNPLGRIKFMFPNHHSVYMHDTIDKHLFKSRARAFSYGCIRVHNPQRLAEVLLHHVENLVPADVKERLNRKEMNRLYLSHRIKVHNTYFTQWADQDGTLHEYKDIYGHDRRIAEALAGKPLEIIAQRDPAIALMRENDRLRSQVATLAKPKTASRKSKTKPSEKAPNLLALAQPTPAARGPSKKARLSSAETSPMLFSFQLR